MIFPRTAYIALSQLSDSDLGKYIRIIFEYGFNDAEPELTPLEDAMLAPIFDFIKNNKDSYDKVSEARKKAANARWNKQMDANDANAYKCMQMDANDALNNNINNNINIDNDIDKNDDKDISDIDEKSDMIYGDSEAEASPSPITDTDSANTALSENADSGVIVENINNDMAPAPRLSEIAEAFDELCKVRDWNPSESNRRVMIDRISKSKCYREGRLLPVINLFKTNKSSILDFHNWMSS